MQYFVISLARTPERLQAFFDANGNRDRIQHFQAVDGRSVSRANLVAKGVIEPALPHYTDGAIGCALSHKRLWEMAIELDEPITILEDDAILHANFFAMVEEISGQRSGWEYLHWGWNFDSYLTFMLPGNLSPCVAQFSQEQMREQAHRFTREEFQPSLFRLLAAFGIPAYSITPQTARKLLDWCFPLEPCNAFFWGLNRHFPNTGIDIVMNKFFQEASTTPMVALPPLAITRNDHSISTIQTRL